MKSVAEKRVDPVIQENKRVLIVGLGKTGLSCARYLSEHGVEIAIADSREHPPELETLTGEMSDVALFLGEFNEQVFESAEELVISPGVSLREPAITKAITRGISVIGDIELFARNSSAPVIAITGSNGKSTVTSLVGLMAREDGRETRVGGNIGLPALDLLQEHEPDLYVLELSSFQLECTYSLNASVSAILNVSPDHMDRYQSPEEYAAAKQRITQGDGVVVLNADDPQVMAMYPAGRKKICFSLDPQSDAEFRVCSKNNESWICHAGKALMPFSELRIRGQHNVANALAALALGHAAGISMDAMLKALRTFQGLPHRTQWVAEKDGVNWYNDSKGTNVGATVAAVKGIAGASGKLVLIAGGDCKNAEFSTLRDIVVDHVRAVVLIGKDANIINEQLSGLVPCVLATDMQDAVIQSKKHARSGDSVLLSPACASFDMFSGYEERGVVFMNAVKEVLA